MKNLSIIIVSIILFSGITYASNNETKTLNQHDHDYITSEFTVLGNCGMCKKTIEQAVISIDGVKKAEWNKETKKLKVTYDKHMVNLDHIHKAIAQAGYDTESVKASDASYNKLPGCCQYDRK